MRCVSASLAAAELMMVLSMRFSFVTVTLTHTHTQLDREGTKPTMRTKALINKSLLFILSTLLMLLLLHGDVLSVILCSVALCGCHKKVLIQFLWLTLKLVQCCRKEQALGLGR